jgi:hypothetical protein
VRPHLSDSDFEFFLVILVNIPSPGILDPVLVYARIAQMHRLLRGIVLFRVDKIVNYCDVIAMGSRNRRQDQSTISQFFVSAMSFFLLEENTGRKTQFSSVKSAPTTCRYWNPQNFLLSVEK